MKQRAGPKRMKRIIRILCRALRIVLYDLRFKYMVAFVDEKSKSIN